MLFASCFTSKQTTTDDDAIVWAHVTNSNDSQIISCITFQLLLLTLLRPFLYSFLC